MAISILFVCLAQTKPHRAVSTPAQASRLTYPLVRGVVLQDILRMEPYATFAQLMCAQQDPIGKCVLQVQSQMPSVCLVPVSPRIQFGVLPFLSTMTPAYSIAILVFGEVILLAHLAHRI